jgi:hypothetical protein
MNCLNTRLQAKLLMPHSFQSGAANSGRGGLLSRLFPTCESSFRPEKPPKKAAAGKIACPTTEVEGWTRENDESLGRIACPTTKAEGWTQENYCHLEVRPKQKCSDAACASAFLGNGNEFRHRPRVTIFVLIDESERRAG